VLHRLGPTFYQAYRKNAESADDIDDLRLVDGPLFLADFLIPGHETWLSIRGHLLDRADGVEADEAFMQQEYHRALGWGYVPLVFSDITPSRHDEAAETWRFTVPDEIGADPGEPAPNRKAPQLSAEPPSTDVRSHRRKR
jgi:hypothetical protein